MTDFEPVARYNATNVHPVYLSTRWFIWDQVEAAYVRDMSGIYPLAFEVETDALVVAGGFNSEVTL